MSGCRSCGADMGADAAFCGICGAKAIDLFEGWPSASEAAPTTPTADPVISHTSARGTSGYATDTSGYATDTSGYATEPRGATPTWPQVPVAPPVPTPVAPPVVPQPPPVVQQPPPVVPQPAPAPITQMTYAPPPARGISGAAVAALVVLALALGGGAAWWFTRDKGDTAAGVVTPTVTVPPSASTPVTEPSTQVTVTETSPAPEFTPSSVMLPLASRLCAERRNSDDYQGWAGNDTTSCPFTSNVRNEYARVRGATPGTARIAVYSPVTKKTYDMACSGTAPVTCRGGNNAVIYLLPKGSETFSDG